MKRWMALGAAFLLVGIASACQLVATPDDFPAPPPEFLTSAAASKTPAPTLTPTPGADLVTEAVSEAPTLVPVPERPLDPAGPWAVFSGPDGVYAANLDGSGPVKLMEMPIYLRMGPVAPQGGRFGLITADDPAGTSHLTLHIFRLPGATLEKSIALTGPNSEPNENTEPGDPILQAQMVYGEGEWSADGTRLAFEGGMDSDNSDLYVYNSAGDSVVRMTTGPALDFGPSWSPDGRYIAHFGAETFGSGAGFAMKGAWLTWSISKATNDLYALDPASGAETILGWLDAKTVLVYSFYASCSTGNLRAVNIADGSATPFWPGYFNQFNISFDPVSGSTLLFSDDFSSCEGGSNSAGGFLIDRNGKAKRVSDETFGLPQWSPELDAFIYQGKDLAYAIQPDGSTPTYPPDWSSIPFISPNGKHSLWVDGLDGYLYGWFGGEDKARIVSVNEIVPAASESFGVSLNYLPSVLWAKDSQSYLFAMQDGLYTGRSENYFVPQRVMPIGKIGERVLLFRVNP